MNRPPCYIFEPVYYSDQYITRNIVAIMNGPRVRGLTFLYLIYINFLLTQLLITECNAEIAFPGYFISIPWILYKTSRPLYKLKIKISIIECKSWNHVHVETTECEFWKNNSYIYNNSILKEDQTSFHNKLPFCVSKLQTISCIEKLIWE